MPSNLNIKINIFTNLRYKIFYIPTKKYLFYKSYHYDIILLFIYLNFLNFNMKIKVNEYGFTSLLMNQLDLSLTFF